jgi:hypothetical protein
MQYTLFWQELEGNIEAGTEEAISSQTQEVEERQG